MMLLLLEKPVSHTETHTRAPSDLIRSHYSACLRVCLSARVTSLSLDVGVGLQPPEFAIVSFVRRDDPAHTYSTKTTTQQREDTQADDHPSNCSWLCVSQLHQVDQSARSHGSTEVAFP